MAAKKSLYRKINDWFHLWLGIASGIPVIIISLTGCLLVYEQELTENVLYGAWWHITPPTAEAKVLPPSEIYTRVTAQVPAYKFHRFWYYGDNAPVKISPDNADSLIYVNPYSGQVLAEVDHENFFDFIRDGHTTLWMGRKVGMEVVAYTTAIFFLLLITGFILWLPKKWNKKTVKDSFTVKVSAKRKRINYDLHNVLGFYSLLVAILIAFTGLIMSFTFIRKGVMTLAGGMKERTAVHPLENLPADTSSLHKKVDLVWEKVRTQYATVNKTSIIINIPQKPDESIYTCTDMYHGRWRSIYFDQQTLSALSSSESTFGDAAPADWIRRSNYGLHTGYIGGSTTKLIYFLASMICTSLPITGFYIWWGKRKKTRK